MTTRTLVVVIVCTLITGACDGESSTSPSTADVTGPVVPTSAPAETSPAAAELPSEGGSETADSDPGEASRVASTAAVPEPTAIPGDTTNAARPAVPDGSGGTETGPLDAADVEIDTGDGTVQIGDAEIPASASDFPVPEGLDVELASDTGAAAGFSGVVDGSVSDVADFYRTALPEAGFEITEERRVEGDAPVIVFGFESPERAGETVVASGPNGRTSLIVTIADR